MSKALRNHRKLWTNEDYTALRDLLKLNTPLRVIALKLGRSKRAVREKLRAA